MRLYGLVEEGSTCVSQVSIDSVGENDVQRWGWTESAQSHDGWALELLCHLATLLLSRLQRARETRELLFTEK